MANALALLSFSLVNPFTSEIFDFKKFVVSSIQCRVVAWNYVARSL